MSGALPGRSSNREVLRAKLPLLDRLIDEAPDQPHDLPLSAAEAMAILRRSVRRDLEALLNARRRWRPCPERFRELEISPIAYGLPDFAAGVFADDRGREALRAEVETTIRRFEPRLVSVRVELLAAAEAFRSIVRLRVNGMLNADPSPEPIAFDTLIDPTNDEIMVKNADYV